ncbi:type II secretion system protein K [Geomonas limicola]|uniref:Type II secretion system protein K n=1 Tax=Geomonas limicola TaxID=2740186 RepID=A0A6V8N9W5_9BACT|nr:type II secretion system minor pseudopilin GspK [Geomonas limicola]GFO69372.1 type II secretion system protein K [Geomonas limicola]
MRGERGFALVITLIVTALLVALLAEFVNEVYVDTSHSHNFVASQQASILAESGIQGGYQLLQYSALLRAGASYSALTEKWAQPFSYDTGDGTVTVTIEEESGKLDLNAVVTENGKYLDGAEVALRLFKNLKLSPDLVDVIMDWGDLNDAPNPAGAETSYYKTLKAPYKAKNGKFYTVEELGLLKGFTPTIVAKLKPFVTVGNGSNQVKVNINTAPKEVLLALDESMTEDLVQRILDYRKTTPIKAADVKNITGLDRVYNSISLKIGFMGSLYRIHSEGKVGDSIAVVEAVVPVSEGTGIPTSTIYWREY